MMRDYQNHIMRRVTVIIAVAVLSACFNPFNDSSSSSAAGGPSKESDSNDVRYGSLVVDIGGSLGASTIAPDLTDLVGEIARYDLTLDNGGIFEEISVVDYVIGDAVPNIPYATWTVTLIGYSDVGGTTQVATGTDSLTVNAPTNTAQVEVQPMTSGTGTLVYTVNYPAAMVDGVAVTLDEWPADGTPEYTLTAGTDPGFNTDFATTGSLTVTASDNIGSGAYLLDIQLSNSAQAGGSGDHAPIRKIVQIYDNLQSTATDTLQTGDLRSPPAAPTGLRAAMTGDNQFEISWMDDSNTEEGFRVYEGPVDGTPEAELTVGTTFVTNSDVGYTGATGNQITYNVVSYNHFGESDVVPITFTTLGLGNLFPAGTPGSPTLENALVTLDWSTFLGVETYNLYISTAQADVDTLDPGVRTPETIPGQLASTYTALVDGATYYWTVEAINTSGDGSSVAAPTAAFTVDTTAPAQIMGISSADLLGTAPDQYVTTQTPAFTFGAGEESGATIEYTTDGGTNWSVAGTAPLGSFTFPALAVANDYEIAFRQVDAAGNVGTPSPAITVDVIESGSSTITITNPGVPTFSISPTDFTLDVGGDDGTNQQSQILTIATGETITAYQWLINGSVEGTAAGITIDAGATLPLPTPLTFGANTLTLIVTIDGQQYSDDFFFTVVDN